MIPKLRAFIAKLWALRPWAPKFDGWGTAPQNEEHARYRRDYVEALKSLPGLPRGNVFVETERFLLVGHLLTGLHNYGDDPVLPPRIRTRVVNVPREANQPAIRGLFSGMAQAGAGPMALLANPVAIGALCFAVPAAWGAVDHAIGKARLNHAKHELAETQARLRSFEEALSLERTARNVEHAALAASGAETRRLNQSLQQVRAQARARERRLNHAAQQIVSGGEPPAWDSIVRDDAIAAPPAPADSGGPGG